MAANLLLEENKPDRVESLWQALSVFYRYPSPWVITITMVAVWVWRATLGPVTWIDMVLGLGVIAFWPFQEWLIHVFILHFKPRTILGRRIDMHVAEKHRKHHTAPWVLSDVFVPIRTLLTVVLLGLPAFVFVWTRVFDLVLAVSILAVFSAFGLIYEWIHYLVHTGWKPRTKLYKQLWQHHRWHHFKNENYWYGVTRLEGDWLLGTAPDATEVPTSPTAKNLDARE